MNASAPKKNPRILIVTPEITYLPAGMGNWANHMVAKAGGLADVSASLVGALFNQGADVHVALPYYRKMFHMDSANLIERELKLYQNAGLPESRIHLAEDRIFHYRDSVYSNDDRENPKIALAFQREVINNILRTVKPDLVHCNDWMTGLIPAIARCRGIRTLFTVHNIHSQHITLERIEDVGIDAAEFWGDLYYDFPPADYWNARNGNIPVDLLASGIFAAHFINTVSPEFLNEVADGRHDWVPPAIRAEMKAKRDAGCAVGILNAPDESYNTASDPALPLNYTPETQAEGKLAAKRKLQAELGLDQDDDAPIFFWPSRLDPIQKGCSLLSDILYQLVNKYWKQKLQVVIVANGQYQGVFRHIIGFHGIQNRVAVTDFNESLSRVGYAGSDFVLMPSRFEPCGLPQMVGALYGSLPIVHNTGGLHDTVWPLDVAHNQGNGFVFNDYVADALFWAIDRAMEFHALPKEVRDAQTTRVMRHARENFTHEKCAQAYIRIYESMLDRPLITRNTPEPVA